MHHNPVEGKLNLVEDYIDYEHSSARFYATGVHSVFEVMHYKEIVAEGEEGWVKGSPGSSARDPGEVKGDELMFIACVPAFPVKPLLHPG